PVYQKGINGIYFFTIQYNVHLYTSNIFFLIHLNHRLIPLSINFRYDFASDSGLSNCTTADYLVSCFKIFLIKFVNKFRRTSNLFNSTNALAASPNILPWLGCFFSKTHLGWITFWKIVRIQSCCSNGWLQIIPMYTSE